MSILKTSITCCKDCDKRCIGCHVDCQTYNQEKVEVTKNLEGIRRIKELNSQFDDYCVLRHQKAKLAYGRTRRG